MRKVAGLALLGVSAWLLLRSRSASASSSSSGGGTVLADGVLASWYGPGFHGRQTANQEVFDEEAMTAAHRTLRFNTRVRVTDLDTGRSVTVRINDRGPFTKRPDGSFARELDLSKGAARVLGSLEKGLARVRLEIV